MGLSFSGLLVNGFVRVRPSRERNVFHSPCGLSPATFLLLRSSRKASYPGDRFLSFRNKKYRGRLLPYKRLMGMCRWMGSHFYDWIDYNGVALSIEFLEWGRTFSDFLGYDSSSYLRLANVPECLYCKWIVKCSSFNLKDRSIHKNRKWLSWDCENYTFAQT